MAEARRGLARRLAPQPRGAGLVVGRARAARRPRYARSPARRAARRRAASSAGRSPRQASSRSTKRRSSSSFSAERGVSSPAKPGRRARAADRALRAAAPARGTPPGASPPAASGCFSAASSGTGASSLAARSSTRRRNTPGGVRFERQAGGIVDLDAPSAAIRRRRGARARGRASPAPRSRPGLRACGAAAARSSAPLPAGWRNRAAEPGERVCRHPAADRARHRSTLAGRSASPIEPQPARAARRSAAPRAANRATSAGVELEPVAAAAPADIAGAPDRRAIARPFRGVAACGRGRAGSPCRCSSHGDDRDELGRPPGCRR